ncbi:NAD(P)/FAD-dependent oxidoreductase [Pseudorhodobacter wandonensis]|jgi:NADPH-dependent 2,4-dienoyl-CoA reductase/sulfur reductase-like enzyme|uniref:NAD(P)/FAD-dependent oxidoreductase n=1 Tax=Pseudorhodobacter wandonensis TaxID=1120568 RepID=UPI00067C23A3|nr:NAD(P)/FAD-dependent oxidoreductase [Pseudorhodobacter wandonensis]
MTFNRRLFLASLTATLAAPMVKAQTRPRVIIIGGGAGGATAARYLAKDSKGALDVVLVEPSQTYYTCFFSNLYLGGFRSFESLGHSYDKLAAAYGINIVHDLATGVDRAAKTVTLASGNTLPYDKLVLSPGIDFIDGSVAGWSLAAQDAMPHAYKGGTQQPLQAQIAAMRPGGTFAMVAPPNPYRCPPGPYERASMVATYLQANNPTAKILILDPKDKFSKQALFEEGWNKHYPGMITRIGPDMGGSAIEVRPDTMEVVVDGEAEKVDVCNVIPAQRAGDIASIAGVTENNWAPVHADSMLSRLDENIYVLGDATNQGDMPKSGFSANSQAKVAANHIRGALTGSPVFPAKYANTCWSLIAADDGVKVGASYAPTPEKIASVDTFISQTGEDAALRKATYNESLGWYTGITTDMFG